MVVPGIPGLRAVPDLVTIHPILPPTVHIQLGLVAVEIEEPRPVLRPVDENKDGPRPSAEVEATASPTAHGHHDQRTVAAARPFPPRPD